MKDGKPFVHAHVRTADDNLPERFTKEYVKGQIVEKEKFETMVDDYYRIRERLTA